MDYSQIAEMAQKAKAYDELKPKYDALVSNLALAKGLLYPDEPYDPADQLYDPTLSPVSLDGDFVNSSEDDHPEPVPEQPARKVFTGASSDSGSWNDGPPRQKLPKRKPHISGNPHGTDQTHNPCITEDQANLASENGITWPKMIVRKGGKSRPDQIARHDEVWDYGLGQWVDKHSQHNPRWKCCLCIHHYENGFCYRAQNCMYAHSQDELRPFTKWMYGR